MDLNEHVKINEQSAHTVGVFDISTDAATSLFLPHDFTVVI